MSESVGHASCVGYFACRSSHRDAHTMVDGLAAALLTARVGLAFTKTAAMNQPRLVLSALYLPPFLQLSSSGSSSTDIAFNT